MIGIRNHRVFGWLGNVSNRRDLWFSIICGMLLVACTTDDHELTKDDNVAVDFSANMFSKESRAANAINDESELSTGGGITTYDKAGFGVFGCYTGLHKYGDSNVSPNFMYNEQITSSDNGSTWSYEPVKYWPNGEGMVDGNTGENVHYVSFLAYAPWSDNDSSTPDTNPAGYCIPSFSLQGEVGNPWLTYRIIRQEHLDKQVDLLYAIHTDGHEILDQKKPEVNTKVQFTFRHALSCVGDKVNIICSEGLKNQVNSRIAGAVTDAKLEVTNLTIEYTLTSKARLVLWNQGEANWHTIWSEEPVCKRTVTLIDREHSEEIYSYDPLASQPSKTIVGNGVFYIPVELTGYAQTARVSLSYRVGITNDGSTWLFDDENSGTADLVLKDYEDAYQAGKHLYINITMNQMSIALTAAIAPWEEEEPMEIEGIEE